MKTLLAVFAAMVVLVAGPAFAQDGANLDPASVAAAKQLVESMKMREVTVASFQKTLAVMPDQMRAALTQMINNDPKASPDQKKKAFAAMERDLPKMMAQMHAMFDDPSLVDDMIAAIIPIYARNFTADEIGQMQAFYQTPVGQKMLSKTPAIMTATMETSQRLVIPRLQKQMSELAHGFAGENL